MFDIIRNSGILEFWTFWGIPFAFVGIAAAAMAFSIWLAWSRRARRVGVEVAIVALLGGFIYGLGGSNRDKLCAAQVAAYEARFEELQDNNLKATAVDRAEFETKIKTVEQDHEEKLTKIRANLAKSEAGACVPSDEFLNVVRDNRTKSPAPGQR